MDAKTKAALRRLLESRAIARQADRLWYVLLEHRHKAARTDRIARAALALERAVYRHARGFWRLEAERLGFRVPRTRR